MSDTRRVGFGAVVWLGLLGALVALVVLTGGGGGSTVPYDPRNVRSDGTRGMVDVLRALGTTVEITDRVPPVADTGAVGDTVVLVLRDDLADPQRQQLLDWVEGGGLLVVADPASALHGGPTAEGGSLPVEGVVTPGDCTLGDLRRAGPVVVGFATAYALVPDAGRCFGDDRHAFVRADRRGDGVVVAVGGPDVFTNGLLRDEGNAEFTASLLAPTPGGRLVMVRRAITPSDGEGAGLVDLVAPPVRQALVQLAVAFVLFMLWQARRLGRPVAEARPVPVAASDLVAARGALLARGRHAERAGASVRQALLRELRRAMPGVGDHDLPAVVAARVAGRVDADDVHAVLVGPLPSTAHDLLRLCERADHLRGALGLGPPGERPVHHQRLQP